ncbi:MAG: T9SS type A sorting domain-containing protein [Saprospiraceae bacterium]|nr:T9SS type A sorting domain-containing protein [Saprospiraceae bacterium]
MRFYILFLLLFVWISSNSQSMTKINIKDASLEMNAIASMSGYGNLGASQGSKLCAINCTDNLEKRSSILLLNYHHASDLKIGSVLYHKTGSIYVNKAIQVSPDEIFILGTYNDQGSVNLLLIGIVNIKINALINFKLISLESDPNFILNPVDVIYTNNVFYILAETIVEYLSNFNSKIVLIKYDGAKILWSTVYNSVAPVHSETPGMLNLGPNGNLLVSGIFKLSTDNFSRMMLVQCDLNGNPLNLKRIELLSADGSYSHRYGWNFIKAKGTNIHLFSQSIVGRSEPGPVLVTMFDTSLTLRTWRNYNAPIRVESATIDGNYFLFNGQAPVENGFEGFAMMKVNSLNAIVEQFKYFKKELKNVSIATSSASAYDRSNDKIWTMVKPNGSLDNFLILLENPAALSHDCAEDLTSEVFKDPIEIQDIAINGKSLQLQLSDFDCYLKFVTMETAEVCRTTGVKDISNNSISLYPNPITNSLSILSTVTIRNLELLNLNAKVLMNLEVNAHSTVLPISFPTGVYLLRLQMKEGSTEIRKIVVQN